MSLLRVQRNGRPSQGLARVASHWLRQTGRFLRFATQHPWVGLSILLLFTMIPSTRYAWGQVPEGFEVIDIVDDLSWRSTPQMNNCGEVVMSFPPPGEEDIQVFLYDNGALIRFTDNEITDSWPDINDDGAVVWSSGIGPPGPYGPTVEIMVSAKGDTRRVTDNSIDDWAPRINNRGHVAWYRFFRSGCRNGDSEIHFYDGEDVIQISETEGISHQGPIINDLDEIAWTAYNFCDDPWTSDVMLYSGGEITQLTTDQMEPQGVTINNSSQVAWGSPDGLELWEDGETTLITGWGRVPRLNNLGDIHFLRWHDSNETWQGWLYTNTGEFYQLTNDPFWNTDGDINDAGEVVWRWANFDAQNDQGYRLMRRIRTGDGDLDGDVDLDDYAMFLDCMTGPGRVDGLCECRFLDIDHDGDVDFSDFARFQQSLTGPE